MMYEPADRDLDDDTVEAILKLAPDGAVEGFEAVLASVRRAGLEAMQCAVTASTLVSFRGQDWDFDLAKVRCGEQILVLDHASTTTHAGAIAERWLAGARREISRGNFMASRAITFPYLEWGSDIEEQVARFPAEYMDLAFKRLAKLDDMVRRWRDMECARPDPGSMEIRNESDLTMQNYGNQRRFRSQTGEMAVFEKHVWIDRHNRIHLIVHDDRRTIEIGYLGVHLPTWTN
ncbi:hypothetical protein X749_20580 [Mesorhizobium sp. LNJC391B00]|nr:hypothetical protein X749_20580 [Mesorhizobium sp. LNJC391B00]